MKQFWGGASYSSILVLSILLYTSVSGDAPTEPQGGHERTAPLLYSSVQSHGHGVTTTQSQTTMPPRMNLICFKYLLCSRLHVGQMEPGFLRSFQVSAGERHATTCMHCCRGVFTWVFLYADSVSSSSLGGDPRIHAEGGETRENGGRKSQKRGTNEQVTTIENWA